MTAAEFAYWTAYLIKSAENLNLRVRHEGRTAIVTKDDGNVYKITVDHIRGPEDRAGAGDRIDTRHADLQFTNDVGQG